METKRCPKCDKVKPLNSFYRDRSRSGGRSRRCKPCESAYRKRKYRERLERWHRGEDKEGYEKYKHLARESARKYYRTHVADPSKQRRQYYRWKENKERWYENLKQGRRCEVCGEDDSACLVFHHRNPEEKEFMISTAKSHRFSKERVLKEIEKCAVLCANCHLKLHNCSL